MSFLNALASDGLTVGLRFYAAKVNRASEMAVSTVAQAPADTPTLRSREAEQLAKPAPPPPPKEQTPEEMAAGRAEAQAMLAADGSLGVLQAAATPPAEEPEESEDPEAEGEEGADGEEKADGAGKKDLTEEEQQQVQEMKKRDQEVRTHEQAHMSAGGGLAGSATYEYATGPDGQKYAVGGEVPISTRGGGDPQQQLRDAETVKRAASAPAEPSSQDRAVAAQASADINRLRGEVAEARREDMAGGQEGEESGQAENAQGAESADTSKTGGRPEEQTAGQFAAQADQNQMNQAAQAAKTDPTAMYGKKMDTVGDSAPKRLSSNGESFGSHVLSAYAAAKFGVMGGARPVLARA